jgi:magnesium-protoporphyrin IX monomethyl ester (oxidative) cyclase
LNKGFTLEHTKNAIKLAKEFGIATNVFLMLGFPWETINDFKETINLAFKLNTDFVYLSKYISFPETNLYKAGDITEKENDILQDRSYVSPRETINGKKINELIAEFYKKYYLSPKRLIKIIILLRLYSLFKLLSPFILVNIVRRIRVIFFVNEKRKVKNYHV